ncbi:hypothetical protein HYT26_03195 [Candidatus Pacearchaeota archaeon]|nr:hypothetical protein [Candidatus Pacearchaeota archaeon]
MDEKESKVEEDIIEERKKKIASFLKKSSIWALIILFIIVLLSINIRTQPMKDHGGRPGLWDITTNTWTLGPDLDPFFFLRYAQIIVEKGSLPAVDIMRNAPLGFEPSHETRLLPYMIAWTYWIFHFSDKSINVEYAAVIFPVIMFALTVIVFFFFVREIFRKKDENDTKASIIALISTFFMAVMPELLPRTVAGIPEKESAAFFFMFLALYLFLKAWKTENKKAAITLAALSGISTAVMGLIWGGVSYVFVTIAISTLIAFVLNKIHKRETILYSLWAFFSMFIMTAASARFKVGELAKSLDTGLALLVFVILIVHLIVWNTKLSKLKALEKIKLPKNIISLILAVILLIILSFLFFGAGFIIDKLTAINQMMFKPVTGRWSQTVAENRQPYFSEWANSFGPAIKNIPVLFWMFFVGSVILFKKMLSHVGKKRAWLLTALYVLFFFGLVFSRYAPHPAIMDGDGIESRLFYYGSALLLIGAFVYYYIRDYKEGNNSFAKIDYNYILLFVLFVLCLFTARSAVRLIMILAPIAPIFVSYLIVDSAGRFKTTKDETIKIIFAVVFSVVLILSIYSGWSFYKQIKAEAYGFVPSTYTQQWQKAMAWVRESTPENAVFAHWWDYGYWVQTIGKRATVTDGGNFIVYWNYLTGRHVLTTDKEKDALEFLYTHNTTHLLIDSTDLGKYGAFAIIGSDENFDRYSPGPVTMLSDPKQSQKTRNGIMIVYQGGTYTDEDISFKENENASEIFLPGGRAAIAGILLETYQDNNSTAFKQPTGVFIYQNTQYRIPLRYAYYNKQLIDYKNGLNATVYLIQRIIQSGQGIQLDNTGAAMYVSPRIMRGLLGQLYILNDAWKNFDNFESAYSEPSPIVDMLNRQGANLNEFVFYEGIQGPIKIWKIKYNGDEKVNPAYLDTDYSKYINWKL